MSQRARKSKISAASSISPSKSKKKSIPIRKKSSPTKRQLEQTSSILTQPRQKRLSSLTAATLLQYCTSILSPSRKINRPTKSVPKNAKPSHRKRQISNVSSKSESKPVQIELHTRTRREASSRASAMILQQNEIERSRYHYSSTSVIRRHRTKSTLSSKDVIPSEPQPLIEPFKFNIPPVPPLPAPTPSITNVSNQTDDAESSNAVTTKSTHSVSSTIISTNSKYTSLTEAILAEHDRLNETLPSSHTTKQDNLIKWTQELALCGRLSPPWHDQEISLESIQNDSITTDNKSTPVIPHSDTKEILISSSADPLVSNESSCSITNNITTTTPTFLFPSSAYPLDLRSFYPLLPCWQYPAWSYQSSASLLNQIQPSSSINHKTSINRHRTSTHPESKTKKSTISNSKQRTIIPIHKQKQQVLSASKTDALTFHLHTHHHHHVHNSNSSSLLKSLKTSTVPLSPKKSSTVFNKSILPISVNNVVIKEHQQTSSTTEDQILNLSINSNQQNGTIKKTTRRKSSPVKRYISGGTKSNSSSTPSTSEKIPHTINPRISSPKPTIDNNQAVILSSVSNIPSSNGNSPVGEQKSSRRGSKRRSVSAATASSITTVSVTRKSSRGNRTNSASSIPIRSKSSINRKRSYSPVSITLPLSNKRKKQNVSSHWILFGKSEQKLVSIDADKPPIFRECYSSIRHITEKDVIKSNDCVILRPETVTRNGATPYLAKVKWFWQDPTSDEIQMSLIWYYHPEHTELPTRVRERFLPNELLASKYWDCVNVACIEDKCYVLNLNEYNRYQLREKPANLFEHSESVGQLKSLLNKNTSTVHHRPLPSKTVGNQNIFFCRYVYDYRVKRILKNPSLTNTIPTATSVTTA